MLQSFPRVLAWDMGLGHHGQMKKVAISFFIALEVTKATLKL